jgi:hypothetical protein
MVDIGESKRRRFQLLQFVWEQSGGNELAPVMFDSIQRELGFSRQQLQVTLQYLIDEGLIKIFAFGSVAITHQGVVKMEADYDPPDAATPHFPANIAYQLNVGNIIGSQIQQGNGNTIQATSYTDGELAGLRDFMADLKTKLSEIGLSAGEQAEVDCQLASIEAQLLSKKPNRTIINACLSSLKSALENGAGTVIGALLLQQLGQLLR